MVIVFGCCMEAMELIFAKTEMRAHQRCKKITVSLHHDSVEMVTSDHWYPTNKYVYGSKYSRYWNFFGSLWYAENATKCMYELLKLQKIYQGYTPDPEFAGRERERG